jgi:hypothetical protein
MKSLFATLALFFLFFGHFLFAQQMIASGAAPAAATHSSSSSERKKWELRRPSTSEWLLAAAIAADAVTTQRDFAEGSHELDPFAKPFLNHGIGGQAAFSALQFGETLVIRHLLTSHGHPKAARWAMRLMILNETGNSARNLVVYRWSYPR